MFQLLYARRVEVVFVEKYLFVICSVFPCFFLVGTLIKSLMVK